MPESLGLWQFLEVGCAYGPARELVEHLRDGGKANRAG